MLAHVPIQSKPAASTPASFTMARTGLLQRKCACGGTPGPSGECEECRKKKLQRETQNSGLGTQSDLSAPPIVHEVLRSPGQPLDAETRAFMEPRFGHDFGNVRVHTDTHAAKSAQAVNALAYAVGNDVVFGTGQYAPKSVVGRQLIAHELTHTLQNKSCMGQRSSDLFSLQIADPNDKFETEAERISKNISKIGQIQPNSSIKPMVRRQSASLSLATLENTSKAKPKSCERPEEFYKTSLDYCKDTKSTGRLHLGKRWQNNIDGKEHEHPITRCYREVPKRTGSECPPGKHICFDDFGHCGDEHEDAIAPFSRGTDKEGSCIWTPWRCVLKHFAADVLHISQERSETPLEIARQTSSPASEVNSSSSYVPNTIPDVSINNTQLGGLSVGNFDFHFKNCAIVVWVWIKFKFTKDINSTEQEDFKKKFKKAVHSVWEHTGYSLSGSKGCPCEKVPIEIHVEENAGDYYHKLVDVERKSDADRRPKVVSDININFNSADSTIAHEFGHVLGLYDEYDGGFFENIMFWHKNRNDPYALMSQDWQKVPKAEQYKAATSTELRPRYFEHYRNKVQSSAPKGCQYTISSPTPPVL